MSANDGSFLTHKLNERIMELNGDLGETPPGWKRNNIMAEIKRIREKELPPAFAALKAAKIPYEDCMKCLPGGGRTVRTWGT